MVSPDYSEKCRCCCVDDLTIQNVIKLNFTLQTIAKKYPELYPDVPKDLDFDIYGHAFDVAIRMHYMDTGETPLLKFMPHCSLKWEEKTDVPYKWSMEAGEWFQLSSNQMFAPFDKRKEHVNKDEPFDVKITDTPYLRVSIKKRYLAFRITVESAEGCPCAQRNKTVTAVQYLESDGTATGIKRQEFEVGPLPKGL